MLWVNTTDLKQWAQRRDCQENLTLLVRKLIRATSTNISRVLFPAGDNIFTSGWDGILESAERNEYIPKELSLWEFGAGEKYRDKANSDYEKRTKNSLGYDQSKVTYIFITPYRWEKKEDWCREKNSQEIWKEVRVYDGSVLEEWIEIAPTVGAWLAKHLGKFPENVQPTDDFWEEWSIGPHHKIVPSLITAGRRQESQKIGEWLKNPPSVKSIKASSRDEALAFIIATAMQLKPGFQEDFFSRSLIVNDPDTFRIISSNRNSQILIPKFEDNGVINRAITKGHHVFIPFGADYTSIAPEQLILPRLDRKEFIKALQDMGFSKYDAQKHSKESGRNISILRRQLEFVRNQPIWAKPPNSKEIIPGLLLGRWDEGRQGDKEIIAQLTQESYDSYIRKLVSWINTPDKPFYKIGSKWRLSSPLDAWSHISSYITTEDFNDLRKIVLDVLSEINPSFELEPEKRYMASMYGKESKYSDWAREGLCQSLILIAVYGEKFRLQTSSISQNWVDLVVDDLLKNAKGERWSSLTDLLPLLAEASPNSFLNSVEQSLSKKERPIMEMFNEFESVMQPVSYHTGLLWALEGLAWLPEYFSRVVMILGKLASFDPGGKLSNRPIRSLRHIFLPWLPQTNVSLQNRLDALEILMKKEPEVAWKLLIELLPKHHDTADSNYKTRWRHFSIPKEQKVTYNEISENHSAILDNLLSVLGKDESKISVLITKFSGLSHQDKNRVIDYINSVKSSIKQENYSIWHELRKILSRHRAHPDTNWVLPKKDLEKLEKLYKKLEPKDPNDKFGWLFDDYFPEIPEGFIRNRGNHREEEIIDKKRIAAIKVIYEDGGVDAILQLAEKVKEPWSLGVAASHVFKSEDEIKQVLIQLDSKNENKITFAQTFIREKSISNNFEWIITIFEYLQKCNASAEALINLLLPLLPSQELWDYIELQKPNITNGYWLKCHMKFNRLSVEENIFGIKKLQRVDRYISALEMIAQNIEELPSEIIIDSLEQMATKHSKESKRITTYYINRIFEELDKRTDYDKNKLPLLEWYYLPILSDYGNRSPKVLHEELSKNPELFAQVIKWIYKSKNIDEEEEGLDNEIITSRTRNAYELLNTWDKIPGTDESNNINWDFLKNWISNARELCNNMGRLEPADIHIGKILATYPEGDEDWPPEQICAIIDSINNRNIKDGFYIGITDKHSISSRSPFEGGNRERNLADHFHGYSEKIISKWPITASVLEEVSNNYKLQAKREDHEAEERDLEY